MDYTNQTFTIAQLHVTGIHSGPGKDGNTHGNSDLFKGLGT